jgi:hemoglobin
MSSPNQPLESPFQWLGGEASVRRLVEAFYDQMGATEPELARLHPTDEQGRVSDVTRERFALFLIEWLGGPPAYSPVHGHPRLRMRHARVNVDLKMRDAWLRSMQRAMDQLNITGNARAFLDARFAEVANFLRNVAE